MVMVLAWKWWERHQNKVTVQQRPLVAQTSSCQTTAQAVYGQSDGQPSRLVYLWQRNLDGISQ